jgi:hypothetical protein
MRDPDIEETAVKYEQYLESEDIIGDAYEWLSQNIEILSSDHARELFIDYGGSSLDRSFEEWLDW